MRGLGSCPLRRERYACERRDPWMLNIPKGVEAGVVQSGIGFGGL